MARASGAHGGRAENPEDLESAITPALSYVPAVIDAVNSLYAASSDAAKGLGFVPDFQSLTA
jgi:acetolactate synthase-1/2/3 large subunit